MKAVLVFCEGRHDVVFAQRSLGAHGGCEWVDRPVGELPSPFGRGRAVAKGLIARRFERQALEDLRLRDAARPPLPCFDAVVESTATGTMFVLVRTHGQDQSGACLELLQDMQDTFVDQPADTFDVSEYAAAFLFDANGAGVAPTVAGFTDHAESVANRAAKFLQRFGLDRRVLTLTGCRPRRAAWIETLEAACDAAAVFGGRGRRPRVGRGAVDLRRVPARRWRVGPFPRAVRPARPGTRRGCGRRG